MMKFAQVGSISSGTLRNEDLLESFSSELDYHVKRNKSVWCENESSRKLKSARCMRLISEAEDVDPDSEEASSIIDELISALDEFAPPYCYFGAIEGDGADFGFWPSLESIKELPHVEDSDGAKKLGEDCCFVNDHGNITVYGGDGSILLELV